mgnify:CR=1 FL=1
MKKKEKTTKDFVEYEKERIRHILEDLEKERKKPKGLFLFEETTNIDNLLEV